MDAIISLTQWERQINVFSGTENWANDKHHDIYSLGIPEYRATSGKILIENSLLKIGSELVNYTISKGNDDVHCCNIALECRNLIFSFGIRVILCHLSIPNLFVFVIGDINDDKRVNYLQNKNKPGNFCFCVNVEIFMD